MTDRPAHAAPVLAGVAAAGALFVGLAYGIFVAAGADNSGYVSQAALWLHGQLRVAVPLSSLVWWSEPELVFSPLGYTRATVPGMVVPTYAPGLPLVMAVFQALAGTQAAYYVVPLLGALTVGLTYRLGRLVADPLTNACAAMLVFASPVFLLQLVQPMSDVAVMAWWLAAIVAAWSVRRRSGWVGVGLLVSAAVLTRPNLVPLAGLFLAVPFLREQGMRRSLKALLAFAVGVMPGVAFVCLLHTYLYGSPLQSGYGPLDDIYSWQRILPNLRLYVGWLVGTQTPLMLLGFAAPFLRLGNGRLPPGQARRFAWFCLVFSAAVLSCYLPYFQFDDWSYLRFILSAFPLLILLATVAARAALDRLKPAWAAIILFAVTGGLVVAGFVLGRSAFDLKTRESRYVATARWVEERLPDNALVLAMQHSGSLHYYTQFPVARYDAIGTHLDEFARRASRAGYSPYLVIDVWEGEVIRQRYGSDNVLARLNWTPLVHVGEARVYDLSTPLAPSQ